MNYNNRKRTNNIKINYGKGNGMDNKSGGGGIGISAVLTIVFLVLKLCNVIDWSWWWVFSPLWITLLLFIVLLIIYGILANAINKRR